MEKVLLDYINSHKEFKELYDSKHVQISEVVNYCYDEAHKIAKNNRACVDSDTVFNWVAHFLQEYESLNKKVGQQQQMEIEEESETTEEEKPAEIKTIKHIKGQPISENQTSLFDFMGENDEKGN